MTALDDYVQQRRVLQFQPSGRRYMYERELEDYIHDRRVRRRAANGGAVAAQQCAELVGAPCRRDCHPIAGERRRSGVNHMKCLCQTDFG